MLHLIAFGKISGDKYAYDYMVKENEYKKIIQHKKEILRNVSPETRSKFTFHVIKSENNDFAQIQKEDPYFANAHVYKEFDKFISAINKRLVRDNKNIASSIFGKRIQVNHNRYALYKYSLSDPNWLLGKELSLNSLFIK